MKRGLAEDPAPNGNFGGQRVVVSSLACIRLSAVAMSAKSPALSQRTREGQGTRFLCVAKAWASPPATKLRSSLSACCRVLEKCLTRADTVREAMFQVWGAGAQL